MPVSHAKQKKKQNFRTTGPRQPQWTAHELLGMTLQIVTVQSAHIFLGSNR